ncbi:hypothetical protein BXZ70DRAFT_665594 [Cristinia sonorae]|uniref:BTB domain-containing protein n=1 Tax=Cristinia sonorae TaxID=1940300 RepID=A0A8K0XSJ1_9AGAR|nr:hypothetical protein BXZ70DRAFT_665594 [Cristinia sonorae]
MTLMDSYTRSVELWFPDGTVILRAEETHFRVYSGILSLHSPIFRDLFTLPQPLDDEVYDGCPVVSLQDGAEELGEFLKVLHRWSYLSNLFRDNNVPALLCVLRMSTKYDVTKLRESAIDALRCHYPQDFLKRLSSSPPSTFPFLFPTSRAGASLAISAANVARESNATILLPGALLACCSINPSSLIEPWQPHPLRNHIHSDDLPGLAPQNLYTVLKARNEIILFTRRRIFGFAFIPRDIPDCHSPECRKVRSEWAIKMDQEHPDGWINPFSPGSFVSSFARFGCVSCLEEAKRTFDIGRRELWDALPGIFGLPGWERLEILEALDRGYL